MPGPLSTPKHWTKDRHANSTQNHETPPTGPRTSGKTMYDRISGKWNRRLANRIRRSSDMDVTGKKR